MSETPKGQEKALADKMKGRRQPGSGSASYAKGDVRTGGLYGGYLIECKQTKHASIRVTAKWLAKITEEALAEGKEPMLHFELKGADHPAARQPWVAIPEWVLMDLLEKQ